MSSGWIEAALPLFREACELPEEERAAFLDQACGENADLRRHLDAMLVWDDDTKDNDGADGLAAPAAVRDAISDLADRAEVGPAESTQLPAIDGYRIVRLIAHGGMGTVYEGEQQHPSRRVAIKVARVDGTTPERARRFELEAQLLARLRHPRIAQIIEAGTTSPEHGSRPFFVMEFVEGEVLTDYAVAHLPTARDRLELMVTVCDALGFAHQRGVIHRDLKPDNVLVEAGGMPKVLDFGVAKVEQASGFGAATMLTEVGRVVGTMGYMSPEQLSGRTDGLGPEADVYSLGVMIYELLTGRRPHELSAITLTEALAIVTGTDAPLLGVVRPEFRGDIEAIVAKALERDSRHRYADAAALQQDLERHLRGEPVLARPAGPLRRLTKWSRRNPALSTAVFGTFVLLTVGLAITLAMLKQVEDARADTQDSLADAFLERAERAIMDRDFGAAAVFAAAALQNNPDNLDGAFYQARDGQEQEGLAEERMVRMSSVQFDAVAGRRLEFERVLPLPEKTTPPNRMQGSVRNLDFHPDGTRLAASVGTDIAVWDRQSDNAPQMLPAGSGAFHFSHVQWSPDGKLLAANRGAGVRIWETTGYLQVGLDYASEFGTQCMAFAPDSSHLALANGEGCIQLWSIRSPPLHHDEEVLLEKRAEWFVGEPVNAMRYSPAGDRLAVAGRYYVQLWDLTKLPEAGQAPEPIYKREFLRTIPGALCFSPDGTMLAASSYSNMLQLWSVENGSVLCRMTIDVRPTSIAFVNDTQLIYGGLTGHGAVVEIRQPDPASDPVHERELRIVDTLHHPGTGFCAVSVTANGRTDGMASSPTIAIQSVGAPRLYRLEDAGLSDEVGPLSRHSLAMIWTKGNEIVYNEPRWRLIHYEKITADGHLAHDGRREVPIGEVVLDHPSFQRPGDGFTGTIMSPDERWLIAGMWSRGVVLLPFPSLDPKQMRVLLEPQCTPKQVFPTHAAAFTKDGSALFLGKMDGTILRWSLTDIEHQLDPKADLVLKGGQVELLGLAISPDGRWLASGDVAGAVRLYDLNSETRQPLELKNDSGEKPHGGMVMGMNFSPDGLELATTGEGPGLVIQWNVASRRVIRELRGHTAWVLTALYSHDGQRLMSASDDSTARVWDRFTGRLLQVFPVDGPRDVTDDNRFWMQVNRRVIRRKFLTDDEVDRVLGSLRSAEEAIGVRLEGLQLVVDPAGPR